MNRAASSDGANLTAQNVPRPERSTFRYSHYFGAAFCALLLIAFIGLIKPGIPPGVAWNAIESQHVMLITRALIQYAHHHGEKFPVGGSSTEVFQKLLDEGYADYSENRPSLFYFPMKGKTSGIEGKRLKPENVCFDVTSPADSSDPVALPLVFSTGFKVSYEPGASARRLFRSEFRWPGFELFRPDPGPGHNCIVIGYRQMEVRTLLVTRDAANANGSAPGFIPVDFKAKNKVYCQLTPVGLMPDN